MTICLFLLLAVIVSGFVSRALPLAIPVPLVQIGLGAVIAVSTVTTITLQPDVFFLLFLPPLLFLDGWRIPKEGLLRDKGTILELALGLVVFTVVGVGFFVHWLLPAIPLSVAFALAAILSPTDPIAVSAIAARVPIPKRLMHILEGESLLNDASGLVCMRFAVAATLTGTFSASEAIITFLWLAFGGIAIGALVAWLAVRVTGWASRKLGEETGSKILISILIPFGAYLAAEHVHCSGILAAVAAGITMSYAERQTSLLAVTRVRRAAVWDSVQFAMNGVIFVLLGEQLPGIVSRASPVVDETGQHSLGWLLAYVVVITAALAVLRLVWVWISLRFTLFRATRRGMAVQTPDWRLVVATSIAGVRGAITLAGILTLPLSLDDGTAFPARDLVVFLAAGVIIMSLITASIGLPILLKDLQLPPEPSHQKEEDEARIVGAEAAIKSVEALQHSLGSGRSDADLYTDVGSRLMQIYRERIDGTTQSEPEAVRFRQADLIEKQLRLAAIRAERDAILRHARARRLPEDTIRKLIRDIDLNEARLTSAP